MDKKKTTHHASLATDVDALLWFSGLLEGTRRECPQTSPAVSYNEPPTERVRIIHTAMRPVDPNHFRHVAQALFQRKKIRILYHGRRRDETTERVVSPQRLVHYRSGWYLDTWCHLRNGLRHFALDRLHPIENLDDPAEEVAESDLDQHFAAAYGMFSGKPNATAVLRFSPSAARWVADECWHPLQKGEVLKDGSYELRVPFSDPQELIMDIMKYGPDVEVMAPDELRHRIAQRAARTAAQYRPVKK